MTVLKLGRPEIDRLVLRETDRMGRKRAAAVCQQELPRGTAEAAPSSPDARGTVGA